MIDHWFPFFYPTAFTVIYRYLIDRGVPLTTTQNIGKHQGEVQTMEASIDETILQHLKPWAIH
jgi:hypothetical protein